MIQFIKMILQTLQDFMEHSLIELFKNIIYNKAKDYVKFLRCGISRVCATPAFPFTVPIILDHPVDVFQSKF